jgi:peptide deformylase
MEIIIPEEYQHLYTQTKENPIVKFPDPILRQKTKPVTKITKEHQKLFDKMIQLCGPLSASGFAAPQLGVSERFFVVVPHDRAFPKPIVLINPEIVSKSGEQRSPEMCMSVPELYGEVPRAEKIKIRGLDRHGKTVTYEFEGYYACVMQHEYDHLDGILFFEKADPASIIWGRPSSY